MSEKLEETLKRHEEKIDIAESLREFIAGVALGVAGWIPCDRCQIFYKPFFVRKDKLCPICKHEPMDKKELFTKFV